MQILDGHLPEKRITIRDKWGNPKEVILPAEDFTYAPTLGKIHSWLFGDWGPLYISWKHGWLCPWSSRVHLANMTCSAGMRKHCPGIGLLIRNDHISHLTESCQRRLQSRVVCYEWCHRLSRVYWDLITERRDEILTLPDDTTIVSMWILKRVYKTSGWYKWRYEKERRLREKRKRNWLHQLEPRERN